MLNHVVKHKENTAGMQAKKDQEKFRCGRDLIATAGGNEISFVPVDRAGGEWVKVLCDELLSTALLESMEMLGISDELR